jgi:hypothetical protein
MEEEAPDLDQDACTCVPHRQLRQIGAAEELDLHHPRLLGNRQQRCSRGGMTCWPLPPVSALSLSPISPLSLSP